MRQLDEKMSMLENYIMKNVEDGEAKLMAIINQTNNSQQHDSLPSHISILSRSLSQISQLKSINEIKSINGKMQLNLP